MMIEQAFMESKTQSIEQSKTLNSIPVILVFEIEEFDTTGNSNDRLYIMPSNFHIHQNPSQTQM